MRGHVRLPSDAIADPNRSLTAAEQRELGSRMERKQMKEFMTVGYIAFPISLMFAYIDETVFLFF